MTKFIVEDWAGNKMPFGSFDSFEDADSALSERLGDNYERDRGEYYIEEEPEKAVPITDKHFHLLRELAAESSVMVELLIENEELVRMVQTGEAKEACLQFVNENY